MDGKKKTQPKVEKFEKTNKPLIQKKEEPKKELPKRKVTWAGGVNVRKEPSLDAEVVTIYPFNFIYEVIETKKVKDKEWLKVKDGWTMIDYSEEVK